MLTGGKFMILLRIKNNNGEFSLNGKDYENIDSINRDDIEKIIKLFIFTKEEITFDDPSKFEILMPSQK